MWFGRDALLEELDLPVRTTERPDVPSAGKTRRRAALPREPRNRRPACSPKAL